MKVFIGLLFTILTFDGITQDDNPSILKNIVHPTKIEKKIAKNLSALYDLAKDGHINYHLARKLQKDMKKSITFYPYLSWPNDIIKIEKAKKLTQIIATCQEMKNRESQGPVKKELLRSSLKICFNKYLRSLSKLDTNSIKFHKEKSPVFKENISMFLNSTNFDELKFLLSRFKKGSKKHLHYSQMLENYFIQSSITPPKHILNYLYISTKLTQFIQRGYQFERRENEKVFFNQLLKQKDAIVSLAEDKKEIKGKLKDLLSFIKLNKQSLPLKRSLKNLLSVGKSLTRRGYYEDARNTFKYITKFNSFYRKEAIFEHLWSYTTQEKYYDASSRVGSKYLSEMKDDSRFTFWTAFSYLKSSSEKKANNLFDKVIANNPLSYYAILSSKMRKKDQEILNLKNTPKNFRSYASIKESKVNFNNNNINIDQRWLRRIQLLGEYSETELLRAEIKEIEAKEKNESLSAHLVMGARQLSISGSYLDSFKIIYNSMRKKNIQFSKNVLNVLFPSPFLRDLNKTNFEFDPIIALSLIRQESGFNRKAESRVGARGLMQLMPATARQYKKNLKAHHLYNPKLNLKIGTKYLQMLLKRYDNNLVFSLAAYNAGENRVDRWKKKYLNTNSILHNIENIPFNETRKYVKLIFRNIFFYKLLQKGRQKDSSSLNKIFDVELGFN